MSTIWIIRWSADRWQGEQLEIGADAERRVIDMIASGDVPGDVTMVERYETEQPDATEDIAIALARRFTDGESVHPKVYDFIETHAGFQYVAGLRRAEMTFAAE